MSIIDSVLAGLAYGLGATAWFFVYDGSLISIALGGFCFAIILMAIPYYKLDFFLGRPGALTDKNIDPIESLIIYFGNFIGVTWIGLLIKIFAPAENHIIATANYALSYLHSLSWDTVCVISVFSGMMFYAGSMAVNRGIQPSYFLLVSFVCIMCRWPTVHMVFYCLWADTWKDFWYLIIPVTVGNVIGSNVWVLLRKHSPTFKNEQYLTPDKHDIVDTLHQVFSDK